MNIYANIMRYFWLLASIVMFLGITYFGIKEGFDKWWYNYIFAFIALFAVYNLVFIYHYHSKNNIFHSEVSNPYTTAAHLIDQQISTTDTVVSKQWIDGQLISLYSTKSFTYTCEPTLVEDKIYLKKAGTVMTTIVNMEGKRY